MKLVYCVGSLVNKGGMERVLANKVNYFVDKYGYEITIITQDQNNRPLCYEFNEQIKFIDISISDLNKRIIKGLTFFKNIFTLRKLYKNIFKDINPDVIIVCERGYLDFVVPYLKINIPTVREFHFAKEAVYVHASLMSRMNKFKHLLVYKFIFKAFDRYDYLALLTERDNKDGNYNTNTVVIPNMMSYELPKESALLECKNVISVGSMHDVRKGFEIQIKLWKKIILKYPNWKLNIYGDGYLKASLQKLIDELALTDKVILHGNSHTMEKHYLDASVFLFTSKAEGLPMVLIEAQSFGIPCVVFDCPTGPSDIIKNKFNGYIVPPNNINLLEKNIINLIENDELRKEMGRNARLNAIRFVPDTVAEQWNSFFNDLIK